MQATQEQAMLKDVEVTARKDWSESAADVTCKDLKTGAVETYKLWRQDYKTKEFRPVDRIVEVGAKLKLEYVLKRGGKKADGTGFYPDYWSISEASPLTGNATPQDARAVFGSEAKTSEAPQKPNPGFNKADFSMAAHNACKYTAIQEQGFIVSMGHESYLESGYAKRIKQQAADWMSLILDLAKNGPDPFAE